MIATYNPNKKKDTTIQKGLKEDWTPRPRPQGTVIQHLPIKNARDEEVGYVVEEKKRLVYKTRRNLAKNQIYIHKVYWDGKYMPNAMGIDVAILKKLNGMRNTIKKPMYIEITVVGLETKPYLIEIELTKFIEESVEENYDRFKEDEKGYRKNITKYSTQRAVGHNYFDRVDYNQAKLK